MNWDWVNIEDSRINDDLLCNFDCGADQFNSFLRNDARTWQADGEAATYVFVDLDEKDLFTRIYGYVSINALGLKYNDDDIDKYLSCAEIRLFAVSVQLHKLHDSTISYSDQLFKIALQNLYEMSTHVIGFKALYLNANDAGLSLYKRNGFQPLSGLIPSSEEDKMSVEGCTPLLLVINDEMISSIFYEE